jgi:hypothetical protein
MGKVINPDSNGKKRNQLMRTGAEILRRLSQKQDLDDEARDMVAALVFIFREIDSGVEESAAVWEKRDYWVKAEEFRQRWSWPGRSADQLQALIFGDQWQNLPPMMVKLLPYFNDIKITKMMRKEDEWIGQYSRLMNERPPAK